MNIELLSIDLSNYCTKQCSFCYNHSRKDGNVLWKPQEVIEFALDCINHGVHAISLGGGEPFEYDGIIDIIDAVQPKAYLSITTNGLPLGNSFGWKKLEEHKPDKIHISLHNPGSRHELENVIREVIHLPDFGIKPGCNLLVGKSTIEESKIAYERLLEVLSPEQIILVPLRWYGTPTAEELSYVAGGKPFQSPSCILGCSRPQNFASVSWDKKANSCSYAPDKQPLNTLDYNGLVNALNRVTFKPCMYNENK
ncbi:MAG: radical SAM protein [Bacteroidales bacterium]|nr:radical SAM protein [Bacteroidales bacterium]